MKPTKKLKLFAGLSFLSDRNLKDDYQIKYGFSLQAEIGLEQRITETLYSSLGFMYRNAILPYNRNKNYYPNLWGLGMSLRYQMNTHHNTRSYEK